MAYHIHALAVSKKKLMLLLAFIITTSNVPTNMQAAPAVRTRRQQVATAPPQQKTTTTPIIKRSEYVTQYFGPKKLSYGYQDFMKYRRAFDQQKNTQGIEEASRVADEQFETLLNNANVPTHNYKKLKIIPELQPILRKGALELLLIHTSSKALSEKKEALSHATSSWEQQLLNEVPRMREQAYARDLITSLTETIQQKLLPKITESFWGKMKRMTFRKELIIPAMMAAMGVGAYAKRGELKKMYEKTSAELSEKLTEKAVGKESAIAAAIEDPTKIQEMVKAAAKGGAKASEEITEELQKKIEQEREKIRTTEQNIQILKNNIEVLKAERSKLAGGWMQWSVSEENKQEHENMTALIEKEQQRLTTTKENLKAAQANLKAMEQKLKKPEEAGTTTIIRTAVGEVAKSGQAGTIAREAVTAFLYPKKSDTEEILADIETFTKEREKTLKKQDKILGWNLREFRKNKPNELSEQKWNEFQENRKNLQRIERKIQQLEIQLYGHEEIRPEEQQPAPEEFPVESPRQQEEVITGEGAPVVIGQETVAAQ